MDTLFTQRNGAFSVCGMNPFTTLLGALKSPLDFLTHFDRQEALDAGVDPAMVRKWEKIHDVYLGPTKWTRQQSGAVAAARKGGFTADKLYLIEQKLAHITNTRKKWELRHRLLGVRGRYEVLRRKAKALVPEDNKPAPKDTIGFGRSRNGKRSMIAIADEKRMAALEFALRQFIDPAKPAGPQMVDAFFNILSGQSRVAPAVPRPLILIPLPDYVNIVGDKGDETVLGLSDGTTITGAEYLREHHSKDLEVALFHPQEGAVNLYDTQRFANKKQRDLARATLPTCPVPDCRHAADNCEIHHIKPWSRGGPTNMDNLATLCPYHNRTNDDDPQRRHRGRIHNIRGTPTWVSPRGYPVANSHHRFGAMHLLYGR